MEIFYRPHAVKGHFSEAVVELGYKWGYLLNIQMSPTPYKYCQFHKLFWTFLQRKTQKCIENHYIVKNSTSVATTFFEYFQIFSVINHQKCYVNFFIYPYLKEEVITFVDTVIQIVHFV